MSLKETAKLQITIKQKQYWKQDWRFAVTRDSVTVADETGIQFLSISGVTRYLHLKCNCEVDIK